MTAPKAPVTPVRVLRLISRLNTGGPAMHTVLLTGGLNGARFASRLVTGPVGPAEGDMSYFALRRGVVPIVVPELGRDVSLWNDLRALWKVYRLFLRERPDIIHTHTAKAGIAGRLAGLLYNAGLRLAPGRRRAMLIHSFHGHVFRGYFSPLKSRLLVLLERALALATDHIVTVSERVKNELVHEYRICPATKVTVVPLGLDLGWVERVPESSGSLRAKFAVPPDRVTIGIVGRLTGIKNHRLYLQAAQIMAGRNVHSFIIGDGELRDEMSSLARTLGLEDRTTFTGWFRDSAAIYADLDIVCLTSRNEGTPAVLIEAMAAGQPFVATDVGGVRDLMVGDKAVHAAGFEIFANGILVAPDDPAMLAAALTFLVDHEDLRRSIGAGAARRARERYSHERLLRDLESLYGVALGRRG